VASLLSVLADIHNFDATHVPPEWHGWMTSMHDATPEQEPEFIAELQKHQRFGEISHVPWSHNLGHQEPFYNYNYMHNQSQVRSRGYNIGNPMVNLPPHVPDAYYTQPGSPYNAASIRDTTVRVGSLDGNRAYKNELWKQRLMTASEKEAAKQEEENSWKADAKAQRRLSPREQAILARGGTIH
jgi:NADH ubiquinone oxidoreductase subunit NDUFA12